MRLSCKSDPQERDAASPVYISAGGFVAREIFLELNIMR